MMRRAVLLVTIAVAAVVGACGDASTSSVASSPPEPAASSLAPASSSTTTVTAVAPTTDVIASIRAQIAKAATDICTLISAKDVGLSFEETVPLTTQPMGEAAGPACGFPHPRAGGYLLVIQFQNIANFDGYAKTGRRVDGLGLDAVLSSSKSLYVRDVERDTTIMFLAPENTAASVDSLLRVVAHIYGKTAANLRVAE